MYLTKQHIKNLEWAPVDGCFKSEFVFKFDNGIIINNGLDILKEGYEYKTCEMIEPLDPTDTTRRIHRIILGFFDGRKLVKAFVKERIEYLIGNRSGISWVGDLNSNKFFVVRK